MDEPAKQVLILEGEPEHAGDHVDGNVLRVLHCSIDGLAGCSISRHHIEKVPTQDAHFGLPCLDLLRSEWGKEKLARLMVERRVARDRWCTANGCWVVRHEGVHDHGTAREVFGVVGDLTHVFMSHRKPRAAITLSARDWARIPQLVPDLVSSPVVLGVGMIEVGVPIGHRTINRTGHQLIVIANSGQFAIASRAFSSSSGATEP